MSKNKTIVDVRVKDIEKWRYPSKHYVRWLCFLHILPKMIMDLLSFCIQVYVLEVTWSEGTKTIIYRRYSRFFEFQVSLRPSGESHGTAQPASSLYNPPGPVPSAFRVVKTHINAHLAPFLLQVRRQLHPLPE